jgi:uncharacterized protein YndB with AHSA1/START domain
MYPIDLSIEIAAPAERLWRALCDPSEVVLWDSSVTAALNAAPDYPRTGQHVRWRCRPGLGPWRILHDRPQDVVPNQRLRSLLDFGPYHMDETYTLASAGATTRLDLHVDLYLRPSLLAPILKRLFPAANVRTGLEASLANLKRHCETSG